MPIDPANRATPRQFILVTEGFATRASLTEHVEEKVTKLRRHLRSRSGVVYVHVRRESPHAGPEQFTACATVEKTGVDHVAHAAAPEPQPAVDAAFDKLERVIAAAAGIRRQRRRHPRTTNGTR